MLGKLTYRRRSGRPGINHGQGKKNHSEADVIIYAGSLVNPEVLNCRKMMLLFITVQK